MEHNYYYFIAGLPEIFFDDKKTPLSLPEFMEYAEESLDRKSINAIKALAFSNDNDMLLSILKKEDVDESKYTIFSKSQMEIELEQEEFSDLLPSYMLDFIRDYRLEKPEIKENPEKAMTEMYYNYIMSFPNEFIRKYADFTLNLKNLVTALVAKKHGKNVEVEIIGDNDFARAIKKSNLKDFGLGDYELTEKVISIMNNNNLVERERRLDGLIWDFLENGTTFKYFSLDNIISFFIYLKIIDRWSTMKSDRGREIFMEMVEKFKNTFEFSEEFA